MSDRTTIYVGNLPPDVNEQMLLSVFSHFGQCINCCIMRDPAGRVDPYAFIEFSDHNTANLTITSMNNIKFMGRELKVNWATGSGPGAKEAAPAAKMDYNKGTHIFVGDVAVDATEELLKEAFEPYGNIIDAKIIRYQDGRSRGYAFISFENKDDAERAIKEMDKSWIMNRAIRCNWATRSTTEGLDQQRHYTPRPYEVVYNESPVTNTNVYVGGVSEGLTEDLVRCHFEEFGHVESVKCYPEKGFAFIRFQAHDAAARAISNRHGYKINNQIVKCWWGKENYGSMADQQEKRTYGPQKDNTQQGGGSSSEQSSGYDQYYQNYAQYYNNPYYQEYYKQYYQQMQQQGGAEQPSSGSNGAYQQPPQSYASGGSTTGGSGGYYGNGGNQNYSYYNGSGQ